MWDIWDMWDSCDSWEEDDSWEAFTPGSLLDTSSSFCRSPQFLFLFFFFSFSEFLVTGFSVSFKFCSDFIICFFVCTGGSTF